MLGGFFRRLAGGDDGPKRSSRLADRLIGYPAWHVPHLGTNGAYPGSPARKLGEAELRANLHAYITAMPERTAVLAALLGEFGIEMKHAYDPEARLGFFQQLHVWLLAELPATWRPELCDFHTWEPSDRAGAHIVYSLMGDIAMLFADVLLRAKPGCFVGMDLDPDDRDKTSFGRPCLLGLSDGLFPGTHRIDDFEGEMFGVYRRMDHPEVAFTKPRNLINGPTSRMIGFTVLEACERFVVEADLPERRASTWMAQAV